MSNAKIPIITTLKALDSWLAYIRSSGWDVEEKPCGDDSVYYYSNAPGYGKGTPLASVFRDVNNRPSVWVYIRLPLSSENGGYEPVVDMHAISSEYQNIEDALGHINITDHDAETSWNGSQLKNIEAAIYKIGQITKKYI